LDQQRAQAGEELEREQLERLGAAGEDVVDDVVVAPSRGPGLFARDKGEGVFVNDNHLV